MFCNRFPVYVHQKTENEYIVLGSSTDCTNGQNDKLMVIYYKDNKLFVREAKEFYEKFIYLSRLSIIDTIYLKICLVISKVFGWV